MSVKSKSNYTVTNFHDAAKDGNKKKLKRIIKTGVNVDAIDNSERTALFHSVFYSQINCAQYLLKNGANPNHRDCLGATPLHIAGQNCNLKMVVMLVEAGGDIRLHDKKGDSMVGWINKQVDVKKRKNMLVFLEKLRKSALGRCMVGQNYESMAGKPEILDRNLRHESIGSLMKYKKIKNISCSTSVHSDGFGKLCVGDGESVGAIATIPIINAYQLKHDDFGCTYDNGPFCVVESMLWIKELVSVKRLHQTQRVGAHVDLLITELDFMRKLHHPCILLLMGICQTENLNSMILIYERVGLGSLYSILYQKLEELTRLQACIIMRNVANGLLYLHRQNMLHCAVNSHSVHVVQHDMAKLSNFEYMIPNNGSQQSGVSDNRYMNAAYNWMPPELILKSPPNEKSDLYGFCAVLWEVIHGELPWNSLSPAKIEQEVRNRCNNSEEPLLPVADSLEDPFNVILRSGLQWGDAARLITLEQARDHLVEYVADQTRLGESSRNLDEDQNGVTYKRTPHRNIKFVTTERIDGQQEDPKIIPENQKKKAAKPLPFNMNISQMDEKIDKLFEGIQSEEFISPLENGDGFVEKLEKNPPVATRRKFISSDKDFGYSSPRENKDSIITCDKDVILPVEKCNSDDGLTPSSDYCFIKNPAKKSFFEDPQNVVPPLPLSSPPDTLTKPEKRTPKLDLTNRANMTNKESQDFGRDDMSKELQLETEEYLKKRGSKLYNWSPEPHSSRTSELIQKINKLDNSNITYKPSEINKPLNILSSQDIKQHNFLTINHVDKINASKYSNKFKTTADLFEKLATKNAEENLSKSLVNSHYKDWNPNLGGYTCEQYNSQDFNERENRILNSLNEDMKRIENDNLYYIEGLNRKERKSNLLEKYKEESDALRNTGLLEKLRDDRKGDEMCSREMSVFSSESKISQTSSSSIGVVLEPKVNCVLAKKKNASSTQTHELLIDESKLIDETYDYSDNRERKDFKKTSFRKLKLPSYSKVKGLDDRTTSDKALTNKSDKSGSNKDKSKIAISQTNIEKAVFYKPLGIEKIVPNPVTSQKLNNQMALSSQNDMNQSRKNLDSSMQNVSRSRPLYYDENKRCEESKFIKIDQKSYAAIDPKSYAELENQIKESAYKFTRENMFNLLGKKTFDQNCDQNKGNFGVDESNQGSDIRPKSFGVGCKETEWPNNLKINNAEVKPQQKVHNFSAKDSVCGNRSLTPVVEPEITKKQRNSNAALSSDSLLQVGESKLGHLKHMSHELKQGLSSHNLCKQAGPINNERASKSNVNAGFECRETSNGINKLERDAVLGRGYLMKGVGGFQKMNSSVVPKNQNLLLQRINYNKFSNSMSNIEDHSRLKNIGDTSHVRGIRPASHHYPCKDIKLCYANVQRDKDDDNLSFHDQNQVNVENDLPPDGNIRSLVHNFETILSENEHRNSMLTLRKNTTFINNDLSALALATPPMAKKSDSKLNKRVCVTPISNNFTQRIKKNVNDKYNSELNVKETMEKGQKNGTQPSASLDGRSSERSTYSAKSYDDDFGNSVQKFDDTLLMARPIANGVDCQNAAFKNRLITNSDDCGGYRSSVYSDKMKKNLELNASNTAGCLTAPKLIPYIDDSNNKIRISARDIGKTQFGDKTDNMENLKNANIDKNGTYFKKDSGRNKLNVNLQSDRSAEMQWENIDAENMRRVENYQSFLFKNVNCGNDENPLVDKDKKQEEAEEEVKPCVRQLVNIYDNFYNEQSSLPSMFNQTPKKKKVPTAPLR